MPKDTPAMKKGTKSGRVRFSVVHWHPDFARDYPKGIGGKPVLLEESQARKYGMITRWNQVSVKYDGTPKVLAIPNYLGSIYCTERPYERVRNTIPRPTCWESLDGKLDIFVYFTIPRPYPYSVHSLPLTPSPSGSVRNDDSVTPMSGTGGTTGLFCPFNYPSTRIPFVHSP